MQQGVTQGIDGASERHPPLVIVSGAPASGKTTLSARLTAALRLALLAKDELKEVLYDTIGAPDRDMSRRLASPAYEVMWAVLRRLLDVGMGAIVESNFYRGASEVRLAPYVKRSRAVLIHCHTSRENIALRYATRASDPARHPMHFDTLQLGPVLDALDEGRYRPIQLDIPVLEVDTTSGYTPTIDQIVEFARREAGA